MPGNPLQPIPRPYDYIMGSNLQFFFTFLLAKFGAAVIKSAASATSMHGRDLEAVIKSAASAACLDFQGSQRTTARHAHGGGGEAPLDSCILVFGEAALGADLITA